MNRFMMRQAQELGTKLAKVQEELEKATVEASSGGGVVTVVVNGQQKVQSVKIGIISGRRSMKYASSKKPFS